MELDATYKRLAPPAFCLGLTSLEPRPTVPMDRATDELVTGYKWSIHGSRLACILVAEKGEGKWPSMKNG